MPVIRKKLIEAEVYPTNIRYNPDTETVQSLVNGEWVDNPAIDPRTHTTLPPRITSNTRCDAAQSVADALKGQIDQTIVAIDNAATAFTIAGIILSLLSFGVFAIFISIALTIADAMIGVGGTALTAALTPSVYEQLTCMLYCHMDASGRLEEGGLSSVQDEVNEDIGGVAATVINSMLSLAGEGGVNNLASLGTATGDCSGCDCPEPWCYEFDFTVDDGDFTGPYGSWSVAGWDGTTAGSGVSIVISRTGLPEFNLTHIEMDVVCDAVCNIDVILDGATHIVLGNDVPTGTYADDVDYTATEIMLNPSSGGAQGADVTMTRLLLSGFGTNPFGTDNCTPP